MRRVVRCVVALALGPLLLANSQCVIIDGVPPRYTTLSRSQPLAGERSLKVDLDLAIGQMTLTAGEERTAYKLDLSYDENRVTPEVSYATAGERGQLDLRVKGANIPAHGKSKNRLDIELSTAIPVEITLRSGVAESTIDLSRLRLKRLKLESGIGQSNISIHEPNAVECESISIKAGVGELRAVGLGNANFRDLEFKGGVGQARLDFTGNWQRDADVEIRVGVGEVRIILPRDVGAEIDAEKRFLSSLHLDSFRRQGDRYVSNNYDSTRHRLRIRVRAGIGSVRVSWA